MIRTGFLDPESRKDLTELARDGLAAHRLARRANALVLLDGGMICVDVAKVLLLDDDTVRTWHRLYERDGIEGLVSFGYDASACRLSDAQQAKLKGWIAETLPRTTRAVGAWIEADCGITQSAVATDHRVVVSGRRRRGAGLKTHAGDVAKAVLDVGIFCARPDHASPGSHRQRGWRYAVYVSVNTVVHILAHRFCG
jgi:transposase|nr:helix-turn-helix domain-containing protein [uncultured Rhodopila sp.]